MGMDKEKQQLSIEVARLYYQSSLSQQEIAEKLNVSRPTISRLLNYAKEKGYVQITIFDPFSDLFEIEQKLKEKYHLTDVQVAFSPDPEYNSISEYLTSYAAEYLEGIIKSGDIIGISWGTTMHKTVSKMNHLDIKGVEVVQLKGGIAYFDVNNYAFETLTLFAEKLNTKAKTFPLPVILDSKIAKDLVVEDRHISKVINLGKQANIAVFTVGTVQSESLHFRLGYFTESEEKALKENAVGDICSRFFDENGKISDEEIDSRTIGIELEELKKKEKSILIAGGDRKVKAIHGALVGGYANVLLIDKFTALKLLNY
ncbi:sugar-binding transcriptional regulator [Enterococcus sp. S22(2020)]|uniref:sugar-binding transcriptional regulator n=2 Tax=unclassified Enterococcus TaxID=2608891 RepID=UPI00298BFBE1|nr:sugar-binding transcriptional regulator [Enterococcus sp. S22(2020)]